MLFTWIDWIPIGLYFALLVVLTIRKQSHKHTDEVSFLLSGRSLTLPAFVATLVSTWYGGILGVGEYSYQFGVSQWLLFGFPFYVFAAVYAWLLAPKIRADASLSIPEALKAKYGKSAGIAGAAGVFALVSPAPYILMLGMLMQIITGGDHWLIYASLIALFSAAYVSFGGFNSVVRTDILQIILMYGGFIILIWAAWQTVGSPVSLLGMLPESHLDFTGGHTISYIFVWFFIALWTFVDPGFHQRAAAAKTPETARNGILISIGFWFIFDLLTLSAGLYAFVILGPDLANPVVAYPELASQILKPGLLGLFFAGMIAVIMSTLDSFLFLSGQTLGRDILKPIFKETSSILLTRISIFIATAIGLVMILLFPSVIELWYVIGTLIIPPLLIPVLGVYLKVFRMPSKLVIRSMTASFFVALFWLTMGIFTNNDLYSYAWLSVEPFYPGLAVSLLFWLIGKTRPFNATTAE